MATRDRKDGAGGDWYSPTGGAAKAAGVPPPIRLLSRMLFCPSAALPNAYYSLRRHRRNQSDCRDNVGSCLVVIDVMSIVRLEMPQLPVDCPASAADYQNDHRGDSPENTAGTRAPFCLGSYGLRSRGIWWDLPGFGGIYLALKRAFIDLEGNFRRPVRSAEKSVAFRSRRF